MRLLNSLSATSSLEISRATLRRAARSSAFASVIRRSTQRRSSFALASVVVIRPCSSNDVQRLRISALRAFVSRLRWRPLFRCLIVFLYRGPREIARFLGVIRCLIFIRLAEHRLHLIRLDEALLDQLLL